MGFLATRRERVIIDLESNLAAGLAHDAVAARALSGELNRLGTSTDRVGTSSGKAGPAIDRFSGRLRLWADAALIVGPALAPLGASIIPVLTGSIAALGAASGGIGAAILAFNGLGDAMKAIDEAQLEPTAENLQAMRIELEKLGPAGAEFAKFLQDLGPAMTQLQMVAREGMFPGMQEGIESLMTRLPQVQEIISQLSQGVGGIAASAGADLASEDWEPFFTYVEQTARPTLEAFGNALGNVAQGLADMLVAFAPVTGDFSRGMEKMSASFAKWAAGLDKSESFKEFLDYIRQSGPQALDLLGSIAQAFAAIMEAAAPVGAVVLPTLTALFKVIGAIAGSPLGSTFLTAAVALTAYNRAALIATATTARLNAAMAGTSKGAAAAASFGPWGAAAALAAVGIMEVVAADDALVAATQRAQDALDSGDTSAMRTELAALRTELDVTAIKMYPDAPEGFFDTVKRGIPVIGGLDDALEQGGAFWARFGGATEDADRTVGELESALAGASGGLSLFGLDVLAAKGELLGATAAAEEFTGAIAKLNGWLDKREALRGYRDSIRDIGKGLKDGFGREDVENIDAVGRSIIQVAESIKSPKARADFLSGARASLVDLAKNAGPKARAEIQNLIDKMDELGLTEAKPKVTADTKAAQAALAAVRRVMNDLNGDRVTTYVDTIYNRRTRPSEQQPGVGGGPEPIVGRTSARGGVPFTPRGGSGASLASINAGKADYYAEALKASAGGASSALEMLRHRLNEAERSLEKETRQRDNLRAKADEVSSGITGGLTNDLWEAGDVWAAGAGSPVAALAERKDRARRLIAAIRKLKRKGVSGAVLAEIIGTGDVERAEFMAAMSGGALADFSSDYAQTQHLVNQAAQMGGDLTFGNAAAALTPEIKGLTAEVKRLTKLVERESKDHKAKNKKNSDDNAQQVGKQVNGAARRGRERVYS